MPKKKPSKPKKTLDQQIRPTIAIDLEAIEAKLPPKNKRSHHVVVKFKDVNKYFGQGAARTHILRDVNFNLYSSEFVVVYGPSGSGKSTILNILLGLENPSSGRVELRGENLYLMSSNQRTQFRRKKIGVVFQQSNWIKALKVWENVAYPLWLSGIGQSSAKSRALESLKEVGLLDWAYHRPSELSGGQQQRVALARAIVNHPGIIVADEPTGNLDSSSGSDMISLLAKLNRKKKRMVIMVTHEDGFLPLASRRIMIVDGQVVEDMQDQK